MKYVEDLPGIDYSLPLCNLRGIWNNLSHEEQNLLDGTPISIYKLLEDPKKLKKLFLSGRLIEVGHEKDSKVHMHSYRKLLKDYNNKTKAVLLSKVGSKLKMENLDIPDKYFTEKEMSSGLGVGILRKKSNRLY